MVEDGTPLVWQRMIVSSRWPTREVDSSPTSQTRGFGHGNRPRNRNGREAGHHDGLHCDQRTTTILFHFIEFVQRPFWHNQGRNSVSKCLDFALGLDRG